MIHIQTPTSPGAASATQQKGQQGAVSIAALYKLIGAGTGDKPSALSQKQQLQLKRVQVHQLQQAAAAEAATVGAWLAPPHEHQQRDPKARSSSNRQQLAAIVSEQQHPIAKDQLQHQTYYFKSGSKPTPGQAAVREQDCDAAACVCEHTAPATAGEAQGSTDAGAVVRPGTDRWASGSSRSSSGGAEEEPAKQRGMLLRARHSAILHVAMMKAMNKPAVAP